MKSEISEGLVAIIRNLKIDAMSTDELVSSIREPFFAVERELGVAFMRVTTVLQKNDDITQNMVQAVDMWERPGVKAGSESYAKTFLPPAGRQITIEAFVEEGVEWTDDDKIRVDFLVTLLFILTSRAQVYGMYTKLFRFDMPTDALNNSGIVEYSLRLMRLGIYDKYNAMFLNLKNMGMINRKYGNKTGDNVLREYVRRVKEFLRDDGAIARRGGDNFTIYITKDRFQELMDFLYQIKVPVEDFNGMKEIPLRSRIGVYIIKPGDDFSLCFDRCNMAYQQTKLPNADDICVFNMVLHDKIVRGQELMNRIKQGMIDNEFVPFYQPKVNSDTLEIIGAEALVRWMRDGKMVSPAEFVPYMEQVGLICDLDFIVFEQVCKQIREWLDHGIRPVRISCNFSREHLNNENLVEDIMAIVDKYDVDTKYIEIEITESSCYQNYEKLQKFLTEIRKKGIHVSIDDFGTGYSSLNMLCNLDVDTIKLDKSFLDHATSGKERDRVLFVNIIRMVADMGLCAITEGVETIEQIEFLRSVHCSSIQGYYFDRPLQKSDFEQRLRSPKYDK